MALIDAGLPGIDGYELVQRALQLTKPVDIHELFRGVGGTRAALGSGAGRVGLCSRQRAALAEGSVGARRRPGFCATLARSIANQ